MKDTRILQFSGVLLCLSLSLFASLPLKTGIQLSSRSVIAAATLLDGRGGIVRNTRVVVSEGKIAAVDPTASPVDIDLGGATVMPGGIGTHVRSPFITNDQGKSVSGGEPPAIAERAAAENARVTLEAGFTTFKAWAPPSTRRSATARSQTGLPRRRGF
jgi:imidazolonepropionase-like amidohydrolase